MTLTDLIGYASLYTGTTGSIATAAWAGAALKVWEPRRLEIWQRWLVVVSIIAWPVVGLPVGGLLAARWATDAGTVAVTDLMNWLMGTQGPA